MDTVNNLFGWVFSWLVVLIGLAGVSWLLLWLVLRLGYLVAVKARVVYRMCYIGIHWGDLVGKAQAHSETDYEYGTMWRDACRMDERTKKGGES